MKRSDSSLNRPFPSKRDPRLSSIAAIASINIIGCGVLHAQDHVVPFSTNDVGVTKAITEWGLDTAWPSYDNMRRGLNNMGQDQVDQVRVTFPVNASLAGGALTAQQITDINTRINLANMAGPNKSWTMTCDTGAGVDAYFKTNNNTEVIPSRWLQAMEISAKAYNHPISSIAPFNEPDYGWNQGTVQNLYDICGLVQTSTVFAGSLIAGASTLSNDNATAWYDALKSRLTEGTTHQLGGSFNNYVSFYQDVIASGDKPVNEEVHNLVEVIAGAEYGIQSAIWWGTAEDARGSFVKACQGKRLAYSEDRTKWSAAAVYRAPNGNVQAFFGNSERNGILTTYQLFSKDRDVFYNGDGPRRDYTVSVGPDHDKMVNITWGDDVQPLVNGQYIMVNRNSGKAMEVAGASTVNGTVLQQNTYTGGTNQQWNITPYSNAYLDQSYYSMISVQSGKSTDLNNYSYDDGAKLQLWTDSSSDNQKWLFEYAGNGYFYIRNRWSGKYLNVQDSSTQNGAVVNQWTNNGGLNQQWRLIPVGNPVEFVAPSAPVNLAATGNAASVRLTWNANTESDLAGYNVYRSATQGGPYEMIARGVKTNQFTDKAANKATTYHYVVKAVDGSLNASSFSTDVSAAATAAQALVAYLPLNGTTLDSSGNANDAIANGSPAYGTGASGPSTLILDGADDSLNLPATVANFSELTISSWVKWNGGSSWQRLFDFGNDTTQYMFLTPSSNSNLMRFAIKNGGAEQTLDAPALPIGVWSHVAVTISNQAVKIYVNGVQVATSSTITLRPTDLMPALNYIGKSQFAADPLFRGQIDDLRIYNYAQSVTDIAAQATTPPEVTPVLAYWRFEEKTSGSIPVGNNTGGNQTNTVLDSSGLANHMMTYRDYTSPTYSTDVPYASVPQTNATNTASLAFIRDNSNLYLTDNIYSTTGDSINSYVFNAFTIEASFKTNATGIWQVVIGKTGNPIGGQAPFSLKIRSSDNKLIAGIVDGAGTAKEAISSRTIAANSWYSAAVTASATELKLWLKSATDTSYVLEATTTIKGSYYTYSGNNSAWVIGLGKWNGADADPFSGFIDEVRISPKVITNAEFLTSVISNDTDGDGMPDSWEMSNFGNLNQTAAGDYDHDGTSNLIEYRLGLSPTDASSFFSASISGYTISWKAAVGLVFTVQRSATLNGDWTNVGTVTAATTTASWTDPAPPAGKAFYRVVLSEP